MASERTKRLDMDIDDFFGDDDVSRSIRDRREKTRQKFKMIEDNLKSTGIDIQFGNLSRDIDIESRRYFGIFKNDSISQYLIITFTLDVLIHYDR